MQAFAIFARRCLLMAMLFLCAAHAAQADDLFDTGPTSLIITYRTAPADRLALRDYLQREGLRQFEQWKGAGAMKDYRVFFNRYVDNDNWDMMLVLSFARYADVARWHEIERASPAGLSLQALAKVLSIVTTPSDLLRSRSAARASDQPVFVILPYDYTVSTKEYISYLDSYVAPQYDGWLEEGVMAKYDLYLARYGSARFWSALFILEYRNDEALGSRDKVLAKVRARLRDNPAWKAISDSKQNVRVGRQYVIADELKLH
jgi:hypothetical protein